MLRPLVFSATILLGCALPPCCCNADPDEEITKGLKMLTGMWVSDYTPRAEGKDGYDVLTFEGNKLIWQRNHTIDGKLVSFTRARYEVTLNPKAIVKEITLTETSDPTAKPKLGVYTIDGDKLTVCFGNGNVRPKKVARPGLLLVLKKQKAEERKGDMKEQD